MVQQYVLNKVKRFMKEHMHQRLSVVYIKNWDDKEDPKEKGVVLEIWGLKRRKLT
jgi:hypothetical protein